MMISTSAIARVAERAPSTPTPRPTGYESPGEAREGGWLGQVPPPNAPPAPRCPPTDAPVYANPQIAPDPWLEPGHLFPHDPTLFG